MIHWKSLQSEVPEISNIAIASSKFYRTALNKGNHVTTVRDEVENIKFYLQIQLLLHEDSFDVEYEIDERLDHYRIVNFILQPLIENAIEHGIDQKRDGRGKLKIIGREVNGHIELSIEDNGPGMTINKKEEMLNNGSSGYGIKKR